MGSIGQGEPGGMLIRGGLWLAPGRFPDTGLIRELCSRVGSGMNHSFYQFIGGRVRFNKIDAFRRNSTIGVVLLAHVSFCLEVPHCEVQVLSWESHAFLQVQYG